MLLLRKEELLRCAARWRCWTSYPSVEEEQLLPDEQQLLLVLPLCNEEELLPDGQQLLLVLLLGDDEELLLHSKLVLLDELPLPSVEEKLLLPY